MPPRASAASSRIPQQPADFIRDNLLIQTSVIDAAYRLGAAKLVFLGSSCIYPRLAPQPLREEYLLTGALESTNDAYASPSSRASRCARPIAAQYGFDAVSVLPTNLYGPNDNFSELGSHVIPGLMRRMHDARQNGARGIQRVGQWRRRGASSCMPTILPPRSSP